jgi:hypothetical protein
MWGSSVISLSILSGLGGDAFPLHHHLPCFREARTVRHNRVRAKLTSLLDKSLATQRTLFEETPMRSTRLKLQPVSAACMVAAGLLPQGHWETTTFFQTFLQTFLQTLWKFTTSFQRVWKKVWENVWKTFPNFCPSELLFQCHYK